VIAPGSAQQGPGSDQARKGRRHQGRLQHTEAVNAIGRTPSDVFLFSKLPEADQQAILRQANKDEFERYIGHAHMKLRKPMRDERVGNQAEGPVPAPSSAPAPKPSAPVPQSVAPPPSRPAPPPPLAQAWSHCVGRETEPPKVRSSFFWPTWRRSAHGQTFE
jgi:hypothetical protein